MTWKMWLVWKTCDWYGDCPNWLPARKSGHVIGSRRLSRDWIKSIYQRSPSLSTFHYCCFIQSRATVSREENCRLKPAGFFCSRFKNWKLPSCSFPYSLEDRIVSYMNMIGLEMHDAEHFFDIIADDCEEPNSTNSAFCLGNVGASGASPSQLCCIQKSIVPRIWMPCTFI